MQSITIETRNQLLETLKHLQAGRRAVVLVRIKRLGELDNLLARIDRVRMFRRRSLSVVRCAPCLKRDSARLPRTVDVQRPGDREELSTLV